MYHVKDKLAYISNIHSYIICYIKCNKTVIHFTMTPYKIDTTRVLWMVHAKNYKTVSTFVDVMQRKLWPLFSRHSVYVRCETRSSASFRHKFLVQDS